jgi:hypothetical protein
MSARRLFFTPRFIYGGPLIITEVWHSPRTRRSYSRGLRLDQLPPVSELFVRPPGVTNSEEFTFLYPDNMQGLFGSGFVELDLARLLSQPRRTPASLTRPRLTRVDVLSVPFLRRAAVLPALQSFESYHAGYCQTFLQAVGSKIPTCNRSESTKLGGPKGPLP